MERMSEKGHEIRVIDFEILWRLHGRRGIVAKREVFQGVHKAISNGNITVIRPPILRLPLFDYLSILITHTNEIKRQMKEFEPDVVVGFGILNAAIAIRLTGRKGVPFIYYTIDELHRLVPQRGLRGIAKRIESANIKKSNLVLSINEALRQYTMFMGAPEERTSVIKAGIDLERFNLGINRDTERQRLHINEKDLVLLFIGWLYDFSGLKELVQQLRRNSVKNENIRLLIVGKGELWNYLRNAADGDLRKRIILLDWQPYETIPRLIAAADICVLPAHKNEIMQNIVPIKMYEYMAMGKPVLATNLKGLRMEFGDGNGVLYVDRPEETLDLAMNLFRENRIMREGLKARAFVQCNDWERVRVQFENSLNELVSENRKRGQKLE